MMAMSFSIERMRAFDDGSFEEILLGEAFVEEGGEVVARRVQLVGGCGAHASVVSWC